MGMKEWLLRKYLANSLRPIANDLDEKRICRYNIYIIKTIKDIQNGEEKE